MKKRIAVTKNICNIKHHKIRDQQAEEVEIKENPISEQVKVEELQKITKCATCQN